MSNGPNRILDEFAKLLTDVAGATQGVRREVETAVKAQAERLLNSMDIVQREEFEVVRDMALKALAENKALQSQLAELKKSHDTTVERLKARVAELEAETGKLPGEDPLDPPRQAAKGTLRRNPKK